MYYLYRAQIILESNHFCRKYAMTLFTKKKREITLDLDKMISSYASWTLWTDINNIMVTAIYDLYI